MREYTSYHHLTNAATAKLGKKKKIYIKLSYGAILVDIGQF